MATKFQKDALVNLSNEKAPGLGFESMAALLSEGLVTYLGDDIYELTAQGKVVAAEHAALRATQRKAHNRSARVRNGICKSLGLKRGSAGWE